MHRTIIIVDIIIYFGDSVIDNEKTELGMNRIAQLHIAGEWCGGNAGAALDVIDPATGSQIGSVARPIFYASALIL